MSNLKPFRLSGLWQRYAYCCGPRVCCLISALHLLCFAATLATGLQQAAYSSLNWEARLTTRSVRATPLTVVVAPAQRIDWDVEGHGGQSVGKPHMMVRLSRVLAVIKGLIAALTGRGGSFALLVDCHFEVDEDFHIVDLDTVRATLPHDDNVQGSPKSFVYSVANLCSVRLL